jgi:hypothetical protein
MQGGGHVRQVLETRGPTRGGGRIGRWYFVFHDVGYFFHAYVFQTRRCLLGGPPITLLLRCTGCLRLEIEALFGVVEHGFEPPLDVDAPLNTLRKWGAIELRFAREEVGDCAVGLSPCHERRSYTRAHLPMRS